MLKTQEEFLEFLGLRRLDKIKIKYFGEFQIKCRENDDGYGIEYYLHHRLNPEDMYFLLGKEYEIIKKAKYVGEQLCTFECDNCPLKTFKHICREYVCNNELYENLKLLKENLDMDIELFSLLKGKLDREAEE